MSKASTQFTQPISNLAPYTSVCGGWIHFHAIELVMGVVIGLGMVMDSGNYNPATHPDRERSRIRHRQKKALDKCQRP
jgi:hypothetical protein